jgi:Putative Ig domain
MAYDSSTNQLVLFGGASSNGGGDLNDTWVYGVAQAPAITSASSVTFTMGRAGTFTVTSTGLPTPALTETGALPAGVSFVDNHDGTATLSGTPLSGTGGTHPLTITASNGVTPEASQSFSLTVVTQVYLPFILDQ